MKFISLFKSLLIITLLSACAIGFGSLAHEDKINNETIARLTSPIKLAHKRVFIESDFQNIKSIQLVAILGNLYVPNRLHLNALIDKTLLPAAKPKKINFNRGSSKNHCTLIPKNKRYSYRFVDNIQQDLIYDAPISPLSFPKDIDNESDPEGIFEGLTDIESEPVVSTDIAVLLNQAKTYRAIKSKKS